MNGYTYREIAAQNISTPLYLRVWGVRHIRAAIAYYNLDAMIASSKYGFDECKIAEETADMIYEGLA